MGCCAGIGLLKYPVSIRTGGKNLEAVRRMLEQQRGVCIANYQGIKDYCGRAVGYAVDLLPPPPTPQMYVSVTAIFKHAGAKCTCFPAADALVHCCIASYVTAQN